jgi:pyrroloquinoline quinone biosynthesis protein A
LTFHTFSIYNPVATIRCDKFRRTNMKWSTPAASDMRFGFEITMYIANR